MQNYRGITLWNAAHKILSIVINALLEMVTKKIIGGYQCGFRLNRSRFDQLSVIRKMMENSYVYSMTFICYLRILGTHSTELTGKGCMKRWNG
jgi:hypothetical protein